MNEVEREGAEKVRRKIWIHLYCFSLKFRYLETYKYFKKGWTLLKLLIIYYQFRKLNLSQPRHQLSTIYLPMNWRNVINKYCQSLLDILYIHIASNKYILWSPLTSCSTPSTSRCISRHSMYRDSLDVHSSRRKKLIG